MVRTNIRKLLIALAAVFMLCACKPKEPETTGPEMIGGRSEEAWKAWEKQQEALKETWGDTEVYVYIRTIMEDITSLKGHVIFQEDFSLEAESKELDQLKKTYADMLWERNGTLQEFHSHLNASNLHWALGREVDLEAIKERENGDYEVSLLYYENPDSLMGLSLTVHDEGSGTFSTDFE